MKIGIIISSLTKNIPYLTYLVSMGYDVYPILLDKTINTYSNKCTKGVIEAIANKNILYSSNLDNEYKFNCLIIILEHNQLQFLNDITFNNIIDNNIPIIISCGKNIENDDFSIFTYPNLHIITGTSFNVVDNCDEIQKKLEKIKK